MSIAVILVLLATLAVVFLVRAARSRAAAGRSVDIAALTRQIRSVDIEAFRNLTDPAEEEYLRSHLPSREFRRVNRRRLRAAAAYVQCASRNAALLTHIAEMARRSPELSVAEAGVRLMESATQLRLYALQATGKLYLAFLFPSLPVSTSRVPQDYERMSGILFLLGRLQNPPPRISAAS